MKVIVVSPRARRPLTIRFHQRSCAASSCAYSGARGSDTCGPSRCPTRPWIWIVRAHAAAIRSSCSSSSDSATQHQWLKSAASFSPSSLLSKSAVCHGV
ncbi:hypothetical protein ACF3MZ_20800 [Paenibacillaceae bacterium WGS1546]|uniref:hypothetical protein n=1 Tax=Cohnella sp. WGS1546 TaxID=3366810 RepID=UPI00372D2AAB